MLVDSHCHIDFPELAGELDAITAAMRESGVTHALCVSVTVQDFPRVRALAVVEPPASASCTSASEALSRGTVICASARPAAATAPSSGARWLTG